VATAAPTQGAARVSLLSRYVGRVVLLTMMTVLLVLVGIDGLAAFIDESGSTSATYTLAGAGAYVLLTLPARVVEFTPYACLIGALLGLGQLAGNSELVVMRANGMSRLRLVGLAVQPALLLSLMAVLVGEFVVPGTERQAQALRAVAQSGGDLMVGRHGLWNRDGNTFMHFSAVRSRRTAVGITLLEFDDRRKLERLVSAQTARYLDGYWVLEQVRETHFDQSRVEVQSFATRRWDTRITPDLLAIGIIKPANLSIQGLWTYGRYLRAQGLDAGDYALALWRKMLLPLAVVSLVVVASAFIFGPIRDGSLGFRLVLGVVIGIVFRTSQDLLGPASMVFGFAPIYAVLVPIVLCLLIGLLLLRRGR